MHQKLKLALSLWISVFLSSYAQAIELKLISTPMVAEYAGFLNGRMPITTVNSEDQFQEFCQGIGANEVDILFADRKITQQDFKLCQQKGIIKIIELPLAYNAILLQTSSEKVNFSLTKQDLYKAFSAYKWDDNKGIVGNEIQNWQSVGENLAEAPVNIIQKIWPTEDLEELYRQYIFNSCTEPAIEKLNKIFKAYSHGEQAARFFAFSDLLFLDQAVEKYKQGQQFAQKNYCRHFRSDRYKIVGESQFNNLKIAAYPKENQIFIATYTSQDPEFLILRIEGQIPSVDTIEQGLYPLSYGMYAYIKMAHVGAKKGLKEYIDKNFASSPERLIDKAKEKKYLIPKFSRLKKAIEAYQNYEHYIDIAFLEN